MCDWRACERLCVWVHLPVAGSYSSETATSNLTGRILRRPAPARKGAASPYADRGRRPSSRSGSTGRSPGRRSRRSASGWPDRSCPPATSTFPEGRSVAVWSSAGRRQASGPGPPSGRGIVELGGRRRVASDVADRECEASDDQHLAGRQERGRVLPAGVVHGSGGGPRPGRGVVELDARRRRCVLVRRVRLHKPSGDQHLAGRQKRRRMVEAIAGERS